MLSLLASCLKREKRERERKKTELAESTEPSAEQTDQRFHAHRAYVYMRGNLAWTRYTSV